MFRTWMKSRRCDKSQTGVRKKKQINNKIIKGTEKNYNVIVYFELTPLNSSIDTRGPI